jgi:hypothetical protein
MKNLLYLALLSTLLLSFTLSAVAKDKNQRSIEITDSVQVGPSQLQPGNYTVEWQEAGAAVNVKFLQHGKVLAEVPGTLKTNDRQISQDSVVTQMTNDNKRVLTEIDFGHQKEALIFAQPPNGV